MKILLIGEYSRLHNSLKEGLAQLGYDAVIHGFNDGFKDYPIDFELKQKWQSGFKKKLKVAIYKLTGFDLSSYLVFRDFLKHKAKFSGFDVVQLINENSFYCSPEFEMKILKFIFENNKKAFLLSCGDDYVNVNYNFKHPENKSVVQPYFAGKIKDNQFLNVLKFRHAGFKKLHEFIYKNISGVIASDLDYHVPLVGNSKYKGVIANPVNVDKIDFRTLEINHKIVIFHGINSENYFKKGSDFFEKALESIQQKYPEKVEIILSRSIPYNEYIKIYRRAHILLDQVFSKDQGYNALEAMASGKVVFTGAESGFKNYYKLEKPININAVADVNLIVNELSALIENPEQIIQIGKNARQFIEKEHHYVSIAKKYFEVWNANP